MDDIKQPNAASETEKTGEAADTGHDDPAPRRKVGPESEVRGGPEAPQDS